MVCRRLSALADDLEEGGAKRALKKRVGQIALSVAKNIIAYGLPKAIAREATDFVKAHQRELSGYAIACGDGFVAAQGLLLRLSVGIFMRAYQRA